MSKAPSRAGKGGKTVKETKKPTTSEKQPATLFEIVPGKFNENDWNYMLECEDSQEFIWDLIDEVLDNTDKQVYKNYIEKQTIPYTINEAKNAIIHLIDWYFLPMDKNEEDLEQIYLEDEEPDVPIVDSWAQGYIQTFMEEKEEEIIQNEESEEVSAETSNNFLQELSNYIEKQPINGNIKEEGKETDNADELKLTNLNDDNKPIQTKSKPQRSFSFRQSTFKSKSNVYSVDFQNEVEEEKEERPRYNRYAFDSDLQREPTKPTRSKLIESESKRVENAILKAPAACHSILKSLLSRPPGYRELEIDNDGNVVSVMKIDSERIPRSNIKPKVSVIEHPKYDDDKYKVGKKNKKEDKVKEEINELDEISEDFRVSNASRIIEDEDAHNLTKQRRRGFKKRSDIDEYDYLLEPAHGVVYKIGKITRTGPKRPGGSNKPNTLLEKLESELRPVRRSSASEATRKSLTLVDELLEQQNENIKPLTKLKPIPPISPAVN